MGESMRPGLARHVLRGRLSLPLLLLFALPTLPMYLLRGPAFSILPALYAERFAIPLASISALLLAVRVLDGVLDVAVGWGTDVTQHRWGGRKSWFLVGSLMTVACVFQLYVPPSDATVWYFAAWFFVAYAAWTVNEIPYGAWAAELSGDYRERSRIAAARQAFNVGSALLLGVIPLLPFMASSEMNFDALAVVAWIVVCTLPIASIACVWLVPHGAVSLTTTRHSLAESWRALRANPAFARFTAAATLAALGDACSAGLGFMILDSYLGLGGAMGVLLIQWAVASLFGVWLGDRLLRRYEKHQVFVGACLIASLLFAASALLSPQVPMLLAVYLTLTFVLFIGAVIADMTPQAMVGDLVDLDRLKTGANRAGQYVAVLTFAKKAAFGLGSAGSIFLAASFGFEPGQGPYAPQAVAGLKLAGFGLPTLLFALAALTLWRYPLSAARHEVVRRRLERRDARVGAAPAAH